MLLEMLLSTPGRCPGPVVLLPLALPREGMLAAGEALDCAAAPWHRQGGVSQLPGLAGCGSETSQPQDTAEQPDLLL